MLAKLLDGSTLKFRTAQLQQKASSEIFEHL